MLIIFNSSLKPLDRYFEEKGKKENQEEYKKNNFCCRSCNHIISEIFIIGNNQTQET